MEEPLRLNTDAALEQLHTLRIAKDLFTSDWYRGACRDLDLDTAACRTLDSVAEETAREREGVMRVVEEWVAEAESPREIAGPVSHLSRVDFLRTVIDAKEHAGQVLERAAAFAPARLRTRLLDLAALDFRHADEVRHHLRSELRTHVEAGGM